MGDTPNSQATRWIPLLVVGILLNTLGIVLQGIGALRYVLMGAGLLLLLVCVLKLLGSARGAGDSPSED